MIKRCKKKLNKLINLIVIKYSVFYNIIAVYYIIRIKAQNRRKDQKETMGFL